MTHFDDITSAKVVHNADVRQFELRVGDLLSLLQYRLAGAKMIIFHTEVPPAIQNQGLAERLTKAALEFARAQELKVEPRCPYTAAFLNQHREYSDLL